jgi:hypothetical protein
MVDVLFKPDSKALKIGYGFTLKPINQISKLAK